MQKQVFVKLINSSHDGEQHDDVDNGGHDADDDVDHGGHDEGGGDVCDRGFH